MIWLKQTVQEALGPKESLIDVIRKNLSGKRPARSHRTVHASDLTKEHFCPREVALLDITKGERKPQSLDVATALTFDIGDATSDLVRGKWLGNRSIGDWECVGCGAVRRFTVRPSPDSLGNDDPAINCVTQKRDHFWRYHEVRFVSQTYAFSGGIDTIVDLGAPKLTVTELKIMAPTEFDKLAGPLAEHRVRTSLYMKLIEDSDHPERQKVNVSTARVLYVSRGHGKKHPDYNEILPFKEFEVERDDSQPGVVKALDRAKKVKLFRDKGLMPEQVCTTTWGPIAKCCPAVIPCFSGKYPASSPLQPTGGSATP